MDTNNIDLPNHDYSILGGGKRFDFIDMAKGIGILLVVIGHLISPRLLLSAWIQNFHMPLFFFISGMLYTSGRYSSFELYVQRKCRVLLKPLLVFVALNLLLNYLLRLNYYTLDVMFSPQFPNAMWFVWVLLLAELVFYPIARLKKWGVGLVVTASFVLSFALHSKDLQLPLSMLSVTAAIGFYGTGYLCKNVSMRFFASTHCRVVLMSLVMLSLPLLMAVAFDEKFDLSNNRIPYPQPLFIFTAVLASVGLIKLCTCIHWKWLKDSLLFWGKTSITTLCLHICFLHIVQTYFCIQPHIVYKVMEIVFVISMSAIASFTMERWGKMLIK